jgi:serine/threonine protein kinase
LPAVECIPTEIGSGDSSVVKLSFDSKSNVNAVRISKNPNFAELIRREAAILKTVKHRVILALRYDISDIPDHCSAIVTEFVENGSLAGYLSSRKYPLIGANRIARIIVGIALAMRFLHSRGVIHRDLNPGNVLLDRDWTVRIADFGQSILLINPEIPSLFQHNKASDWPSGDFHYLAPECYDHSYSQMSDVFSFGVILYELLVGKPAFPKDWKRIEIACAVAVKHKMPDIPKFVRPSVRELITECWAEEPGDRPPFDDIVDRLNEMKFKVMTNVNPSKISAFVKEIEDWESRNLTVPQ